MKSVILFLISIYQKISKHTPPVCRFTPTCSEYTRQAVEKYGALKGSLLAVWRVLRCNPWSLGGVDFVPDKFSFYTLDKRYGKGKTVPDDDTKNNV